MKTRLISYEPIHAMTIIDERIRKHDLWLTNTPGCKEWPFKWAEHPAYTLIVGDEVILCGGIMLTGWRNGDGWSLLADNFKKYPIAVFKAFKSVIETISREHNLKRVQVIVDPAVNGSSSFLERLGFQNENVLRAFGPDGEDFFMFSKIIQGN